MENGYVLSLQQKNAWRAEQVKGQTAIRCRVEIREALHVESFSGAFAALCGSHSILSTSFLRHEAFDYPLQQPHSRNVPAIAMRCLTGLPAADQEDCFLREHGTPPEWGAGEVPLRVTLWQFASDRFVLSIRTSPLLLDKASLLQLVQEWEKHYHQGREADGQPQPQDALQYLQYAQWQHDYLAGGEDEAAGYWQRLEKSTGEPARLIFENACIAPATPQHFLRGELPAALHRQLNVLLRVHDITAETFFLACWAVILDRYKVGGPVRIGYTSYHRDEELASCLGPFAKVLPFPVNLAASLPPFGLARQFAAILREHWDCSEAFRGEPGEDNSRPGSAATDLAYGFQYLDGTPTARWQCTGLESSAEPGKLTLSAFGTSGQWALSYGEAFFDEKHVTYLGNCLEELIQRTIANPGEGANTILLPGIADQQLKSKLSEEYWLRILRQVKPLPWPGRRPEAGGAGSGWHEATAAFPPATAKRLNAITGGEPTGAFMLFLTALQLLLNKYTGQEDCCIGTPDFKLAGERPDPAILLFFTLRLTSQLTVRQAVQQNLANSNEISRYRDVPFNDLQQCLHVQDPALPAGVLQAGLGYDAFNAVAWCPNRFGLSFLVGQQHGAYTVTVRAQAALCTSAGTERLAGHFLTGLEQCLNGADCPLVRLDVLGEADKRQMLTEFNQTQAAYPAESTLVKQFEEQVRQTPWKTALVYRGVERTYAELNRCADALSGHLRENYALQPGDRVGLVADRSDQVIVAILAVLKAGAAYVPVEAASPAPRISYILEDAGVKLVLTDREEWTLTGYNGAVCCLASGSSVPEKAEPAPDLSSCEGLAYIIYTSGSTGMPKGCQISHRNTLNYVTWAIGEYLGDGQCGHFPLFTPLSFDLTITSIFCPLLSGKCLHVLPAELTPESALIHCFSSWNPIDIVKLTPSHVTLLSKCYRGGTNVRKVIVGGEAFMPAQREFLESLHPDVAIINEYGPTEVTVGCITKTLTPADRRILIGKPIANTQVCILNQEGQLVPVGVAGELCLSGESVSRGYVNNPAHTEERFVVHPFLEGRTMYRTGDVGQWTAEGEIEYLGRNDDQIKVNGYRVEVREICTVLLRFPGVKEAVVVPARNPNQYDQLIAYLVCEPAVNQEALGAFAQEHLPHYMLPACYIELDNLPLTPNGKLDKKALPSPEALPGRGADFEAPGNALEGDILAIWQEILAQDEIGVNDNFFRLNGDSIKGIRIINRLQDLTGQSLHINLLFNAPTIRKLAGQLQGQQAESRPAIGRQQADQLRKVIQAAFPPRGAARTKNPPVAFVLSPPRAGSSLLRVILAGHPKLFAPPELELLSYDTLGERRQALEGKYGFCLEGTIRAVMELKSCTAEEAKSLVGTLESSGATTQDLFRLMQEWAGNRLLIDKSPSYPMEPDTLAKMEECFEEARYIHLVRNPFASIHSFEEAELEQVFRFPHAFSRRELAELVWLISHQNTLRFLEGIPAHRKCLVAYERLVTNPEETVRNLCEFLGINYLPSLLDVYEEAPARMTDYVHKDAKRIGDSTFFRHTSTNRASVERWRETYRSNFLGEETKSLAAALGYRLEDGTLAALTIPRAAPAPYYPMSAAQRRLWTVHQLKRGDNAYNILTVSRLKGRLDVDALHKAFVALIGRHEILRTAFAEAEGKPVQIVHAPGAVVLGLTEERLDGYPDPEGAVQARLQEEIAHIFDLTSPPLFRVRLLPLGAEDRIIILNVHHIIFDAWSKRIFIR
jgi:amino acid adenylation domain-containing protein